MITVFINNIAVQVNKDLTVLQACESVFAQVPVFCYHEKLSIAGNCRMCLVEIEKSPKPVASCAMPLMDNMKIYTETPLVKKAREAVLEFLLLNHPLDCPICDQGGECDLQDQSMVFGSDRSRFYEFKHSVKDKNCGPLIKTIMTRCIHCTRCVRFATEVLGVEDLGMTGRGNLSEIGLYVDKIFQSELSGNVIDLCPVGALTAKPYAFTMRSWELQISESVDISDGLGSNILIYSRDSEIMRILPKFNKKINGEWISDKTRFSFDGLQTQRLGFPMIRENGVLIISDWKTAFFKIQSNLQNLDSSQISAICGNFSDLESNFAFKDFFNKLGVISIFSESGFKAPLDLDFQSNYFFNTSIENIEKADLCLLVGVNLRTEGAVLNAKIRKKCLEGSLEVASIGTSSDLSYSYKHLGLTFDTFINVIEGRHSFSINFKKAKNPIVIFGLSFFKNLQGFNYSSIFSILKNNTNVFKGSWNGLNILHVDLSYSHSLEVGFGSNHVKNKIKTLFLMNYDEVLKSEQFKKSFLVYQGSFWDQNAKNADVILASATFIEHDSFLINTEGRVQKTNKVLGSPNIALANWKIFRGLSEILMLNRKTLVLGFQTLNELHFELFKNVPSIKNLNQIVNFNFTKNSLFVNKLSFSTLGLFNNFVYDFYKTNTISRLSKTMSKCSKVVKKINFN
jgi:NADH dehydrogenase (ubiquinone) Fe-S protein 1